jgi:hypothetical protein
MRQNLPEIHGGGGQDVRSLNVRILCVFLLSASLTTTLSFAQSATQSASADQTSQAKAPLTLVEIHRQVNDQAVLVRAGNPQAITSLSSTIFQRVGIPVEVADAFHYTARLAQAETDYRTSSHAAVHEEDLVRAINNLAHTLGAPEWAHTTQPEVRKLRMEFMVRYPQLLANQAPPDENGRFQALSKNISPTEAAFLATSLIYQKLYSPEYQMTAQEKAAGGKATVSAATFRQRTQQMSDILHGRTQNLSLFDLVHAADGLFSDLGISSSLRPEFENLQTASIETTGKEGR